MDTVIIDGSTGEGGGQILRTGLALSCITGRSLHIKNIRAARRNPGLARQHLSCVEAACRICSGKCRGAVQSSKVLDFHPGAVQSGNFCFDIGSAGSASLVIQTLLPALFLADKPSTITVTGGTHNPLAPPFDFFSETFLPAIETGGFGGNCKLVKHGFFPAGGGKITFDVQPRQKQLQQEIKLCRPRPVRNSTKGGIIQTPLGNQGEKSLTGQKEKISNGASRQFKIYARIYTAKLPAHIAQRQRKLLLESPPSPSYGRGTLNIQNVEHIEVTDSDGPGNCVMIRLCGGKRTTVFTAFGMRGKPSRDVVDEVVNLAKDFLASGAAVDRFLADQLLIYMAIAKGGCFTTNELSSHLLTNIEIIKKFLLVDFQVDQQKQVCKVSCRPA